jgi:predicted metal-binding membrane protein
MATTATSPGRARSTVAIWATLLAVAALCWAWLLTWSAGSSMGMDAAMGMSGAPPTLAAFLGVWVVMMAAMMLPSVAPVSRTYLRVLRTGRPRGAAPLRVVGLVAGYLLAWAGYGLVAFVLTHRLDSLAATSDRARVWAAAAALAVAGIYQFTPLKATCLRHCRSPLSVLLHVGNFTGPLRDVRVGVWHGGYCLGCCWSLMLVLVAVGVMNMVWMAALTVVIFLEKVWRHGRPLSRVVGVGLLVLAVLLPWQASVLGL